MNFRYFTILFMVFTILLTACNSEREPMLPNITGKAGEVVVVAGGNQWENEVGQIFRETLGADVEVLPQSEPMFNLVNIPWPSFTNIFKTHRNLVLISINTGESKAKMIVRRNVWAKPQTAIEIIAPSDTSLVSFLRSQTDRISDHFLIAERNRITDNYRRYEKSEISQSLLKNHQLSLIFPAGYTLNVDSGNFVWISNETPATSQGVLVYYYDYSDPETFTPENLLQKRNSLLQRNIPGPIKNSYMTTEMAVSVVFSEFLMKDKYYAELRGLWRVENDFMGGPFVSLSTLDEKRNRVITVEGYVYAPNTSKRNLLRQVEAILYTLEIFNEP